MIAKTPTLFEALSTVPVLAGITAPAQLLIATEGIVHDYLLGDLIVREGDEGHSFFILVEGDVEVIKHFGSDHAVTLAKLRGHTFFGEMSVVDPVPRTATVRALTAVKVIEVKAATLHHLYRKMPEQYAIVILNLARDLARRLRTLDEAYAAKAG